MMRIPQGVVDSPEMADNSIVFFISPTQVRRELKKWAKRARKGVYAADITDDGKVIQLHWDIGEMTNVSLQSLIDAYLDKLEIT